MVSTRFVQPRAANEETPTSDHNTGVKFSHVFRSACRVQKQGFDKALPSYKCVVWGHFYLYLGATLCVCLGNLFSAADISVRAQSFRTLVKE